MGKSAFARMFLTVMLTAIVLMAGCVAPQPKLQWMKQVNFTLTDSSQAKQAQKGITIELKPVDINKEYQKEIYNQKIPVVHIPLFATKPIQEDVEISIQFFYKLLPFEVTIINNTDHILRMRDSRVAYIDPNSDEPVMALDAQNIKEDVWAIPIANDIKKYLVGKYNPQNDLDPLVEKAIIAVIKRFKFINGFNMEIMPGMKATGTLLFPVDPETAAEGKVSFIDMVSVTDKAGNPVERVRFDYRVKPVYKYFRYNVATDKDWTEVNESEYTAGVKAQGQKQR